LFIFQISVPSSSNGWEGSDHLPTFRVEATSRSEARAKIASLLAHLPKGCTVNIFAI
jgi:hypothetical protein